MGNTVHQQWGDPEGLRGTDGQGRSSRSGTGHGHPVCPPPSDMVRSPIIDVPEDQGERQISNAKHISLIKIDSLSPTQIDGRML